MMENGGFRRKQSLQIKYRKLSTTQFSMLLNMSTKCHLRLSIALLSNKCIKQSNKFHYEEKLYFSRPYLQL